MATVSQINKDIQRLTVKAPQVIEQDINRLKKREGYDTQKEALRRAEQNVMNTNRILEELPDSAKTRTRRTLTTQGQLDRLVASESEPLAKSLAQQSRAAETSRGILGDIDKLVAEARARKQGNLDRRLAYMQSVRDNLMQQAQLAQARRAAAASTPNLSSLFKAGSAGSTGGSTAGSGSSSGLRINTDVTPQRTILNDVGDILTSPLVPIGYAGRQAYEGLQDKNSGISKLFQQGSDALRRMLGI